MQSNLIRAGNRLAEIMPSQVGAEATITRIGTINTVYDTGGYWTADVDMSGGTARIARKELAEIVFSSAEAKKKIESIAHPIILEIVYERVDAAKRLKKDIVIDAPLLFESGLDDICDITVGVVTDEKLRFERAMKRGGITEDNLRRRMELQPKNEFYASRCDYIIENDGTADDLKVAFRRVLSAVGKGGANDG